MIRRLRTTEWLFDGALALVVVIIALPFIGTPWDVAAIVMAGAAVVLRRSSPPLALGIVSAAAIMQMLGVGWPNPVNIAQLVVLYACAAFGSRLVRRVSLAAAVAGAAVAASFIMIVHLRPGLASTADAPLVSTVIFIFLLVTLVCAWLLGLARYLVLRARNASVAQQIAQVQAERDRELVASELERGRVAREMHDVLAHSLVSIAMLADGTRVSVRGNPDEAEDLARTIGDVARESVTDVRRLLAELRHGQSETAAPTIADLPTAIGRAEALGLIVDRTDHGDPQPLTPGVSLAVARVMSECLTNALRHGDVRHPVRVRLDWRLGALQVTVRNRVMTVAPDARGGDGPDTAVSIPRGGHGLIGIRERVLLEAGTIDVRREGPDFVVEAVLPTGSDPHWEIPERAGETNDRSPGAAAVGDGPRPRQANSETGAVRPARASGEDTE